MQPINISTPHDPFEGLDAVAQADLVRSGQASALELVDAAIARIELLEPTINAFASRDFEGARRRARHVEADRLFAGVPTLIKDILAYPGLPFECGSQLFRENRPTVGSDYTSALDRSGLIVLGKSATSEFGLLGSTESLANGPTRNPWNTELSAGGSSGGSAAAVACGMVPVAHASDGGGSIRGPASLVGLFGFKPSRGRTLSTGLAQQSPMSRLLSDHCISLSVRDSATWLAITERKDNAAPLKPLGVVREPLRRPLRIGCYVDTAFRAAPASTAKDALASARRLCESLGHEVVSVPGPRFDASSTRDAFFALAGSTMMGMLAHMKEVMGAAFDEATVEPFTRTLVDWYRQHPMTIEHAWSVLDAGAAQAMMQLQGFDVLLCPTLPFTAFPLGTLTPESPWEEVIAFTDYLAGYTPIASFAGWPAMSLPLYWSEEGLPVGCQFSAALGEDRLLMELAYQLEQASDWSQKRPLGA